jgi:ferredoxin-type protein NapH
LTDLQRQRRKRKITQAGALVIGNAWLPGFVQGTVYQGPLKAVCLPGLNCYSCPGALGACPLGSIQYALANPLQVIPFYVIGFLTLLGGLLGRFVCGWLCPFGLFQEGMYALPLSRWRPGRFNGHLQKLSFSRYVFLGVFVVSLPLVGMLWSGFGEPAFCKWICPSGTLMAGIPLLAANEQLRQLASWLFGWKVFILLAVVMASAMIYRPFCRLVCPLGAIYGLFNRISLYRVTIDEMKCDHCEACSRQCPMAIDVTRHANGSQCIRCGECEEVCPQRAIRVGFALRSADRETSHKPVHKLP